MPIVNLTEEICGDCGLKMDAYLGIFAITRRDGSFGCSRCSWGCERCEAYYASTERLDRTVGPETWCVPCRDQYAYLCQCCLSHYPIRLMSSETIQPNVQSGNNICPSCIRRYYLSHIDMVDDRPVASYVKSGVQCLICGVIVAPVVTPKRCSCGSGTLERPVHAYSCKPKLIFRGKSRHKIHMGFELETKIRRGDDSQEIHDAALFAMQALQIPDIAQLKNDSSIGGGFEIVTQPHTFEKYRDDSSILWETINTLRKVHGARSWDTKTCGLHIHVSRNAFSSGRHTHNFIEFIYRNPEMLKKFAGRNERHYATFGDCYRQDLYEKQVLDIETKLSRPNDSQRGSAVNTQNEGTLELRFFRGTMNPSGVLAALGLTHAMVEYTRTMVIPEGISRDGVFNWEDFGGYVDVHAEEYKDLAERMPLIKNIDLNYVPNIQA